jgi:hypothetical protein
MTKRIIISVHDISPKYKKELIKIFCALKDIKKKEAFVILNWENKHNLRKDKKFISCIKENFNSEQINLHGLTHYSQNSSLLNKILFGADHKWDSEFKGINYPHAKSNLSKAMTKFKMIFKIGPDIFLPPRWDNSKELLQASKELKIKYSEDSLHMINLNQNRKLFSFCYCGDYGDNYILNKLARPYTFILIFISRVFNLPLRYSIHPNDINNGNFKFEVNLLKKLIKMGWIPTTTKEIWEKFN